MTDLSRLALNTATLGHNLDGYGAGWSPERIIDEIAAREFGGVVFWRRELTNATKTGAYAKAMGVPIIGLCRTPYLIGAEAALGDMERSLEQAEALGAKVLTIVVGGVEPATRGIAPSLDLLQQRLEQILPLVEKTHVSLALEPLHPVYAGNRSALVRVADAVDIVTYFDHPQLQIAIDVYHVWWDLGLAEALARADGRIAGFHLCDWSANTTDILLDRAMMGDGIADIQTIRTLVEGAGFDGVMEVEIFSKENWWKRDPTEVLNIMTQRFSEVC